MSKDYYKILGIEKSASKEDIKRAFRSMAHKYHPDKGGGEEAAKKFKEASEAYAVLSDDAKRKQYDTFGSADPGAGYSGSTGGYSGFNPGAGFGGFDFSQFTNGQGGFHFNQGGMEFDLGDIFGEFFGGGRGRRARKGATITVDVQLSFKDSIFGTEREVSLNKRTADGKNHVETISLKIPAGIENGQGLRVPAKGEQGEGGPGDLIVRVWVKEHPVFRKEAFNLVMELAIKLTTALTGGAVTIETLDGQIELKIPAGTSHGEILRLKGKGVPYETRGFTGTHGKRGDLLIVTRVEMPRKLSKTAQRLIDDLKKEGL
ncbi:MAG: DnaJ domain-containing protein [Patescibacteria group bacterium]|nr:DnaJ domain-containing protein [Patescibacteria group bacterium]MDE2172546.1 DnaJ domain-containing protein [Patescibacteria group bacterium]